MNERWTVWDPDGPELVSYHHTAEAAATNDGRGRVVAGERRFELPPGWWIERTEVPTPDAALRRALAFLAANASEDDGRAALLTQLWPEVDWAGELAAVTGGRLP